MTSTTKRRISALEAVQADPMHSPRLIVITWPDAPSFGVIGYQVGDKDWLAQADESLAQLAERILAAANGKHVIAAQIVKDDAS